MTGRVAGKVVVVTRAGQGQGAPEARLLAAEGATVIGCDLKPEPAEELPGVEYRQLDVTDAAGWAALADDLRGRFGRVDGLVANAGVTWRARLADLDRADLARVSEVNVTGTLLGIQALARMTDGGSVVVVGSVALLQGPGASLRAVGGRRVLSPAKSACLELGPLGIRVNTVHPGYIETPMTASAAPAFRMPTWPRPRSAAPAASTRSSRWCSSSSATRPPSSPARRSPSTAA